MRFRQVHLDFHTSEAIADVGSRFSKENFQKNLKAGHVDSITVFSKCHHGWAYHPSKANIMHPTLTFDLLKAEIEAAHEINVKTPVYLSAGLDEKEAREHPEWLIRDQNDAPFKGFLVAGYHHMCLNSPYLDVLLAQIEEVVENYDADGIFLDIVSPKRVCYCKYCRKSMKEWGYDVTNPDDVKKHAERVYKNYTERVRKSIDKYRPGLPVFHNAGHISHGRTDLMLMNTHIEMESLPTGGWGYDHFPMSVRYVQKAAEKLGMDYLGMTGKFHQTWGGFGEFKHPNALRYEAALNIANGAKCSIGDQAHPFAFLDNATYELIGAAYSEVEEKEPWLDNVSAVSEIAVLSNEAVHDTRGTKEYNPLAGATRMLLEGHYLFDIIDSEECFEDYKVLILCDDIRLDASLRGKIERFLENGGKVLFSGESGLDENDEFAIDMGVKFIAKNELQPSYAEPYFDLENLAKTAFVLYSDAYIVKNETAEVIAGQQNPFFNRTWEHFCSHRHTPNTCISEYPGICVNKNGAYIAWKIFSEYASKGSLILKELFNHTIDLLLGDNKGFKTNLPAQGIVTLQNQKGESRLVNHLIYGTPTPRGDGIGVIEDIIPIYNTSVEILCDKQIKRVYLAPQMEDIEFTQSGNKVKYTVPEIDCHQMVVLDY